MSDMYLKCLIGLDCKLEASYDACEYTIVAVRPDGMLVLLCKIKGDMRYADLTSFFLTQESKRRLLDKLALTA